MKKISQEEFQEKYAYQVSKFDEYKKELLNTTEKEKIRSKMLVTIMDIQALL